MIETDPRFMIFYVPPFLTFGGIKIDPAEYESSKFNEEVSETIKSVGGSLERAYEIKTRIKNIDRYSILTEVRPIISDFDKRSVEANLSNIDLPQAKYIKKVSRKMIENNKNSAIITKESSFDIFHILEEKFNPENTEYLLKAIEGLLFNIGGRSYNIDSSIEDGMLSINLKLDKPPSSFYV